MEASGRASPRPQVAGLRETEILWLGVQGSGLRIEGARFIFDGLLLDVEGWGVRVWSRLEG